MEANNIIQGLVIIEKARPKNHTPYHVRAEHDKIYAGSLDWILGSADDKKLEDIGWSRDEEADGWRAMV